MHSNVYDDVADYVVCHQKHENLNILGPKHYFFFKLKKNAFIYKIHHISKYIKVHNMTK